MNAIIPCISDTVRKKVKKVENIDGIANEPLRRFLFYYKCFTGLMQCDLELNKSKKCSSCRYCSLNKQVWEYFEVKGDEAHALYDDNAIKKAVNFDVHKLQFDYLLEQFYNPERGKNTEKMNVAQLLLIEKNSPLNYLEKFCIESKIDKMKKLGTHIMENKSIAVDNYKDLFSSDILDVSSDLINSWMIVNWRKMTCVCCFLRCVSYFGRKNCLSQWQRKTQVC